ncbi:hypothetical protein GW17_00055091 [Ensete ventricosum]|nr:hypothetical protein GW17_00055091 [Ensete ventricosum]
MSDRRPTALRARLALIPATAVATFFPWRCAPFLAEQQSHALAALHDVTAPAGCRSIASGLSPAIEVAIGAARITERDTTMATIGTFTSNGNGFTGSIRTLTLNVKAKLTRVENPSEKGPHFRIFAGTVELGAAWQKTARDTERDYLSVKLDDPSFPAPIYATLIEVEGQEGLQLIWSRPNRD